MVAWYNHKCRCASVRSEEHTSELQSPCNLVCRLLLEKKITHATTRICRAVAKLDAAQIQDVVDNDRHHEHDVRRLRDVHPAAHQPELHVPFLHHAVPA